MTPGEVRELRAAAADGAAVSCGTALAILRCGPGEIPDIFAAASETRRRRFGDRAHLCSIMNAKSGACGEDCAFCAQSVHHKTDAEIFALRRPDEMGDAYEAASARLIDHFGIVTSGEALSDEGVACVCEAMRGRRVRGVAWCASLGAVGRENLVRLRGAGMKRFHHNLETAESFFPAICRTHTYPERLATVRLVRASGLEICCGGILGMGESLEQRVEFACALAKEDVDSIPLNFLVAIPGTPLTHAAPMAPLDILRAIAMFRMTNPRAEIKVCAGRTHLRDLQSMVFHAGATGIMVGDLLTTAGRQVAQDLRMIEDLQMELDRAGSVGR